MSLLLSRYCTLLLPELQASEDSHGAFILRTWSSMSVLSFRFRYYMSAHEGPSSYSRSSVSGYNPVFREPSGVRLLLRMSQRLNATLCGQIPTNLKRFLAAVRTDVHMRILSGSIISVQSHH